MICKLCEKKSVASIEDKAYCRTHYIKEYEKIFLDNTDENNLGVVKWLHMMYPDHYRDKSPNAHIEVFMMLLRLYDARYINKNHRLRELIAYRGFAKSSIIFGFISYILIHNGKTIKFYATDGKLIETPIQERNITILSETGGMAEEFVVRVRDEFTTNKMLRYFYKFDIQDAKDDETGQWTRRAFKYNGAYLIGLGAGMQVRGRIKGAYRPTLMFFDDIYSENNVATEERRSKIKGWFDDSALNSVDDLLGKALLVGTIVHDDTVLVECEISKSWHTLKFFPMPLLTFKKFIKEHLDTNLNINKCSLPFDDDEEMDEFVRIAKQVDYFKKLQETQDWGLEWVERIDLYYLSLKYKAAVEKESIAGFYQEYFHQTVSDELRKFKAEYFQKMDTWSIEYEFGYTWLNFPALYNSPQLVNIELGVDMAGQKAESDNSCITVSAITAEGKVFVLEQSYGKYSMRDILNEDSHEHNRLDKIITDTSYLEKKGYIDETFRLTLKYHPRMIKIGTGGQSEPTIYSEFLRVFRANSNYTNLVPRIQSGNEGTKHERIKNTLIGYYETRSVWHANGLDLLEHELEFLGKTKNDDNADSHETSIHNITRPPRTSYSFFQIIDKPEVKKKFSNRRLESIEEGDWKTA